MEFIKKLDLFGRNISLNMGGRIKQGTALGGLVTILVSVLLVGYFGVLVQKLAVNEPVKTTTLTIYHDL